MEDREVNRNTPQDNGFIQGVAYCAAEAHRAGDDSFAHQLLVAAGIGSQELRRAGVDSYDAKPCRVVLRRRTRTVS